MASRMVRINGYPIDIARSEEIRYPSRVTPHAVESGSDFTDNIHNDSIEVTLECLVSDTPIGRIATDPTRQLVADNQQAPSEDARARLLAIREARQPFTIETSKGRFENMALEDLSETANSTTTGGLTFTAKFKQIVIRSNRRTLVRIATRLPGGVVDFGLSLDKLIDGKRVLWRKGKPPGSSPSTDPPGVITGTEVLTVKDGKVIHAKGKAMTEQENIDFVKDLNRDSALQQRRAFARIENEAKITDAKVADTVKRANAFQDTKEANPGKQVDPKLFGLGGKPEAFNPTEPTGQDEIARRPDRFNPI